MKHGSLFSGIGGFDLAAQWMGWENVFHCEWNPFCQQVLKYHWPNAITYDDITKTDFTIHRGAIDVLSGGFPCQPFSQAGKRKGTADSRYLWPEMLRAIREIQPQWIVGENVSGFVNWNDGLVFDTVCSDLEIAGYQIIPFIIPAAGVGAPHRRDRIWFVAHAKGNGNRRKLPRLESSHDCQRQPKEHWENNNESRNDGKKRLTADTDGTPPQCRNGKTTQEREKQGGRIEPLGQHTGWEKFPSESPVCGGNDGIPRELDRITFSKWRNESIKAYGNAVVPQIPFAIFKAIEQFENQLNKTP